MEEEPVVPKPSRRTLAIAMSGALAVGTFGIPSTAHAGSTAWVSSSDGCGKDDVLTLNGPFPNGTSYSLIVQSSSGSQVFSLPIIPGFKWNRNLKMPNISGPLTVIVRETHTTTNSTEDLVVTDGAQTGSLFHLTDVTCVYPSVTFNDPAGSANDSYTVPNTYGVIYREMSSRHPEGRDVSGIQTKVTGKVTITARTVSNGFIIVDPVTKQPADFTREYTFSGPVAMSIPANKVPRLITDPDGDVVRIYNVPGVVWTVDGKSVQVTGKDSYKEFPVIGKGSVNVIAAPATPATSSLAGQYEWTFGTARVVTIAKDKVPTASDQAGSKNDSVVLSYVPGVRWRVGSRDVTVTANDPVVEVPTGGAASVRVIALPTDSSYRINGTSAWTLAFKTGLQVTIPASKLPVANDQSGTENDSVTVYAVDGVTWTVGTTEVVFDKGETSKTIKTGGLENVTVTASLGGSSSGGGSGKGGLASTVDTELAGQNSWDMMFNTAVKSISARPSAAARTTEAGITPRQSVVRWAQPARLRGPATYDVAFRIVNVTAAGKRMPGSWKPWLGSTKATSGVFTGLPGGVYEVSVRATGADGTVSAWSAPSRVIVPLDIRSGGKGWKLVIDKKAASSTLVTTSLRGATWATVTPATDRIMAWVGTGPTNGYVNVVVDGKLRARINTWSARPHARQMLINVPVEWGKHRLAFVNAPIGKRTVTKLDALAYNR